MAGVRYDRGLSRSGDLYTLGVARATPTSKSATPVHASAASTWERAICRPNRVHCHLTRSIFRSKRVFCRPERVLCWFGRPLFRLRGPFVGFKRALFWSRRALFRPQKSLSWPERPPHWPEKGPFRPAKALFLPTAPSVGLVLTWRTFAGLGGPFVGLK